MHSQVSSTTHGFRTHFTASCHRPGSSQSEGEATFSTPFASTDEVGIVNVSFIDAEDYLHVARTFYFGATPVGMVHVWIDKNELETGIHGAAAFVWPILADGFIPMCTLGILLLYTPLRVLENLSAVARRLGDGDLTARAAVNGRDGIASFCRVFNDMADSLEGARQEIHRTHIETIHAMINVVEAKGLYIECHCLGVSSFTGDILGSLVVPRKERCLIESAALRHDIGKIGIPDSVLLKEAGPRVAGSGKRSRRHSACGSEPSQELTSPAGS